MTQRLTFEYLVNSLWQVPLLALATWILIRLTRPALLPQHLLWIAALLLGVLLPLRGIQPEPPAQALVYPVLNADLVPYSSPAPHPESFFPLHTHPLHLSEHSVSFVLALYAVTIALSFARLVHGFLTARRFASQALAHPLTTLESSLLHACAEHLHHSLNRIPEIRFLADFNAIPMVVGIRHPLLLLPESLRHTTNREFDDRALTAIFAHELAHIRRRDFAANLLARIVALPIAYHPATHILHSRIRQTREMLCDAHAALAFDSSSTYARSLLSLAATLIRTHTPAEAVGLFDQTRSTLEERIMKLTEPCLPSTLSQRTARIAAGTAVILATVAAATVHLKPSAPSVLAAHLDMPLQEPVTSQAPASVPAPASAPAPAPKPQHARVIVSYADLAPEQRAKVQRDIDEATAHASTAMEQLNSPEFQQQMDKVQVELKRLNSPEFRRQIVQSERLFLDRQIDSPEYKLQMDALKLQFNSPEFRKQMEPLHIQIDPNIHVDLKQLDKLKTLSPQVKVNLDRLKVQLDSPEFHKQIEEARKLAETRAQQHDDMRRQLAEASKAIAEARTHITDAETQRKLDEAQHRIDQAGKTF